MSITDDFFNRSKIDSNQDTIAIMNFLSSENCVNKMIIASDMGLPAITPIVAELEERFGECEFFPLNHKGKNQNAANRQNVGRMVKFIMSQFGYIPLYRGLNERSRIPKFANSQYFSTATVYIKAQIAKYNIKIDMVKNLEEK